MISKDTISGKFQDPDGSLKTFNTARVEDPDLVKELSAQKVRYWAEPQTEWMTQVLTWVIPGLWWTRLEVRSARIRNYEPMPSHWLNRRLEDVWLTEK